MTPRKVQTIVGFNFIPPKSTHKEQVGFREWQKACLESIQNYKRAVILSPTGSGKSTVAMARGAIVLAKDPGMKHLITVPQNVIGTSFTKKALEEIIPNVNWNGIKLSWYANPEDMNNSQEKLGRLEKFLKSKGTSNSKRIMVCSHQALVGLFQKLKDENRLNVFNNVLLTIDEVHHSASFETEDEDTIENRLGEVVNHFFVNDLHLDMFTATLMRANYLDIIPAKYKAGTDYVKYVRHIDEHLRDAQIGVSIRFLVGSPDGSLKAIYAEDQAPKTIVYLPAVNSWIAEKHGGKYELLSKFKKAIGKKVKSIDLVTENGREGRKDKFLNSISKDEPDLLFALNMCKEGFDWPGASRSIVVGPRGSMVDVVQMLGRLLREHPGKKNVEFNIVLPVSSEPDPEQVQSYLNFIVSALVVEYQFKRPKLNSLSEQKVVDKVFVDDPVLGQKVLGAAINAGIRADEDSDAVEVIRRGLNSVKEIEESEKDVLASVLSRMIGNGIDGIENVDGPKVVKEVFRGISGYAVKFGYTDLKELREALGKKLYFTDDGVKQAIDDWFKKYGNIPNTRSEGYIELYPGDTWKTIDTAFRIGIRGFPGGSSLYEFCVNNGLLQNKKLKKLSDEEILYHAIKHKEATGKLPNKKTKGEIPGLPGYTWKLIESHIRTSSKNKKSLAMFLSEHGEITRQSKVKFNKNDIIIAIKRYHKETGKIPNTKTTGIVYGFPGDSWLSIGRACNRNGRNINEKTTIRKLAHEAGLI